MTGHVRLSVEKVLAAFDEHLRRMRGVCQGTRRNYAKYVGEFLVAVFGDRGVEFAEVRDPEVAGFIGALRTATSRGRSNSQQRRCGCSSGSCALRDGVRSAGQMPSRWCRIARPVWFGIWTRGFLSS